MTLGDRCPLSPTLDRADARLGQSEPRSGHTLKLDTAGRADLTHVGFGEASTSVPRAGSVVAPVACLPVGGVVRVGPEVQVVRPNASPVVARVKYALPLRDGSACELPGGAVRRSATTLHREPAVAAGGQRCLPLPTACRLGDLRPEPLMQRHRGALRSGGLASPRSLRVCSVPSTRRSNCAGLAGAPTPVIARAVPMERVGRLLDVALRTDLRTHPCHRTCRAGHGG